MIAEFPGDQLWCRLACSSFGWLGGPGNNTCEGLREAGWAEGECDCDAAEASANLCGVRNWVAPQRCPEGRQGDQTCARSH